jgi:hypothetical protein
VIYILANIMYLAVVPLYDTTAESDRVAVVASQFLVLVNINHRGDDYDFDFACNKDYGGPECIIRWRKTVSSRKPLN